MTESHVAASFADHPTAAMIVIGDEILSGRTQDKNVAFLGSELNSLGILLAEVRVVGDVTAAIVYAVNELRSRFDYVFTTGGIGPTHDDITTAAVAAALQRDVVRDPEAERRLLAYYPEGEVTPERMSMADVPRGAELIDNPVSAAPGYRVENVFVFAGIPSIMRAMFTGVAATLTGGNPILSRTLTVALAESRLSPGLDQIQSSNEQVIIGCYPFMLAGSPATRVVIRSDDSAALSVAGEACRELVGRLGGVLADDE